MNPSRELDVDGPAKKPSAKPDGRSLPPLTLLVFVVGAAALGIEIAAVRLLAPYFGASEVVWANTIGVVLVALSAGYWFGGRVADKRPRMADLCATVMIAACFTAALPFVARPLLNAGVDALDAIDAGAFAGSLLATLALVSLPVFVLGTVAPWALRIGIDGIHAGQAGALAGRLYAVSTAGSLVGTLLAALVLVPGIGTRRTFLAFALALALVALPGVRWRARFATITLLIALLFALPAGGIKNTSAGGRVIHETETRHQYARVIERADGSRALELNEGQAIHSLYRPGSIFTGDYWDTALVLPFATLGAPPRRIAVLGNAAGTIARAYALLMPGTFVDGVEIDAGLTKIGRRYFGLGGARFSSITADARPFLRETDSRYDALVLDAYRQPYIPFYLTTREFFALARDRLSRRGSIVVNVGHPAGDDELERVLASTMANVFEHVGSLPVQPTNTMLVASDERPSPSRMRATAGILGTAVGRLADAYSANFTVARTGSDVYTDDRAPVEWLIDRSIVRYAAGE